MVWLCIIFQQQGDDWFMPLLAKMLSSTCLTSSASGHSQSCTAANRGVDCMAPTLESTSGQSWKSTWNNWHQKDQCRQSISKPGPSSPRNMVDICLGLTWSISGVVHYSQRPMEQALQSSKFRQFASSKSWTTANCPPSEAATRAVAPASVAFDATWYTRKLGWIARGNLLALLTESTSHLAWINLGMICSIRRKKQQHARTVWSCDLHDRDLKTLWLACCSLRKFSALHEVQSLREPCHGHYCMFLHVLP